MESITALRSVLATTLNARGHGEQGLFDDLILHKSRLRDLLDVGQPSPQEQRELQSGACFSAAPPRLLLTFVQERLR